MIRDNGFDWDIPVLEVHDETLEVWATAPGRLASGHADGGVVVWDLEGDEHEVHHVHEHTITALVWMPVGLLASASDDGLVRVWDPADGAVRASWTLREMDEDQSEVAATLAIGAGDELLVTDADRGDVWAWDLRSDSKTLRFADPEHSIDAMVSRADGLIVSGTGGTLRSWDAASGRERARFEAHTASISAVAVTDDDLVVSGSDDGSVRVWRLHDGELLACSQSGSRRVESIAVIPPPPIWPARLRSLPGRDVGHRFSISGVRWHPAGFVLSTSHDGSLRSWNPATGLQIHCHRHYHESQFEGLALSSDGALVTLCGLDRLQVLVPPSMHSVGDEMVTGEHVRGWALGPEDLLVTVDWKRSAKVWDLSSRAQVHEFVLPDRWLTALVATSDGSVAVLADDTLGLWDLWTGEPRGLLDGLERGHALASGPDNSFVVGDSRGHLHLWDFAERRCRASVRAHAGAIEFVAFTDHGLVISGGADMALRAWHPPSGRVSNLALGDAAFRCADVRDDQLVVGDAIGNVWFLAVDWTQLVC